MIGPLTQIGSLALLKNLVTKGSQVSLPKMKARYGWGSFHHFQLAKQERDHGYPRYRSVPEGVEAD